MAVRQSVAFAAIGAFELAEPWYYSLSWGETTRSGALFSICQSIVIRPATMSSVSAD
jgi:hypothetical protein